MKVNCWNEYDSLKTVILGSVYDVERVPEIYKDKDQESLIKINEQSHNELLEFQKILEQLGVKVLRPKQPLHYNHSSDIIPQAPLINMRDFHLAYGNLFFLTYGSYGNRRFQHAWLESIVNEMIAHDNLVLSANEFNFFRQPPLDKNTPKLHYISSYRNTYKNHNLFHTASLLKHNKKALASGIGGSPIGTKWIKNWLNTIGVEFITFSGLYGHIDGQHAILNQDLLLCHNPETVLANEFSDILAVPGKDEFWSWLSDRSTVEKARNPTGWLYECQGYFQDFCAEANALSIDPHTVCLSFYDKDFYDKLKNKGINGIYIPWKNRHFWGGGLHCITLDIEREHAGM